MRGHSEKIKYAAGWCAIAAVSCAIFWFSAQNGEASASLSDRFTVGALGAFWEGESGAALYAAAQSLSFLVRKSAHFLIYLLLGGLCMFTFCVKSETKRKAGLFSLSYCVIYAALDELHQFFVPGRAARFLDVGIDTAGALSGILLVFAALFLYEKRKAKKQASF